MIQEVRRKIRSNLILRYYSVLSVADEIADTVTGTLYAVTNESNELVILQATEPVARQTVLDAAATLETALNEEWFELPLESYDDEQ